MDEVRRILVVADDIAVRDTHAAIGRTGPGGTRRGYPIGREEFHLTFCNDPEIAHDLVERIKDKHERFSVAFVLPDKGAHELAGRIRGLDPDIELVVPARFEKSPDAARQRQGDGSGIFYQRKTARPEEIYQLAKLLCDLRELKMEQKNRHCGVPDKNYRENVTPHPPEDPMERLMHRLRTPVASILGFCDTLLSHGDMPEAVRLEFLGIIREEGVRLDGMIDGLRALGKERGGSGQEPPSGERFRS